MFLWSTLYSSVQNLSEVKEDRNTFSHLCSLAEGAVAKRGIPVFLPPPFEIRIKFCGVILALFANFEAKRVRNVSKKRKTNFTYES